MKLYKIFFYITLLLCVSCNDDFLDTVNPNAVGSDNFWKTEADAKLALMGCYSSLQQSGVFDSDWWGTAGAQRLDYISDDGYFVWTWIEGGDIPTGQFNASSWIIGDVWGKFYKGIARCNEVIAKVPNSESLNADVAKRITAEAKVIRATLYNGLAMTYTDVPLITEPQTVENSSVPKNTKAEIFAFITQDLAAIIDDLPLPSEIASSDFGRIDRGAAMAMLARLYLYNQQYTEAANMAQKVIDLNYYELFTDYKKLFKTANEANKEVIYRVAFDRILDEGSSWIGYWGDGPMDFLRPLPNLAEEFYMTDGLPISQSSIYDVNNPSQNRDPRFSGTLVSKGDTWRGNAFNGNAEFYFTRKYAEEDNNEDHFNSSQDFYVIRFADVLLMRAEALVQSGSYSEAEVFSLINKVRARVNMPSVQSVEGTGLSVAQILNVIKHERRVEFAFEGLRYYDLVRWDELDDKYEKYMQSEYQKVLNLGYPDVTQRVFKSNKWPLPQSELDVNKQLVQHTEW